MGIRQRYTFQLGLVLSALTGSLIGSALAVEFLNRDPSKGYLYGLAIAIGSLVLSKIIKRTRSSKLPERVILIGVWLLVHLSGVVGFLILRPPGLESDVHFWIYFQGVNGAIVGMSILLLILWGVERQRSAR
jgi:hypothetical protein